MYLIGSFIRRNLQKEVFILVLFMAAGVASATTNITALSVTPASVESGESVAVNYSMTTDASEITKGEIVVTVVRGGSEVDRVVLSSLVFSVGPLGNVSGTVPLDSANYRIAGNYTVYFSVTGEQFIGTSPLGPFTDSASTEFEVRGTPPEVSPTELTLKGKAGETPVTTFVITSGVPPFVLESANDEGRGSFSTSSPGLNETVTYGFRIPSSATDQQTFTDIITVIGADGTEVRITAVTTAVLIDQGDIDDAMQSIASTPPQKAVAAAISTLCPAGVAEPRLQEDCNVVVGAALSDAGSLEKIQASTALGEVTVDQASAPLHASQTSIQSQNRNLGTRIAALRGGVIGFSARGLSLNINGEYLPGGLVVEELARELIGAHGSGAGSDTAWDLGRLGIFVNGSLTAGDKDKTRNEAGFEFDAISLTLGIDYRFSDQFVAGAALGYVNNETDLDASGGSLDMDGYSLSFYGSYYRPSGLYLDGIFTYGQNDYDQHRNIRYQIGSVVVNQAALASFDGTQWSASVGGGYSLSNGGFSFGPTLRLEYVKTRIDGFQERMSNPNAPGGGWATRIQKQDMDSFTIQLGGEVSYAISQNWGILLPNASLEWVHEFQEGSENVVGHFVQDTSRTLFSLPTDNLDKDYANLGLGVSAQFSNGRSAYLHYRKLLGYSDLDAYTVAAGVRLEF